MMARILAVCIFASSFLLDVDIVEAGRCRRCCRLMCRCADFQESGSARGSGESADTPQPRRDDAALGASGVNPPGSGGNNPSTAPTPSAATCSQPSNLSTDERLTRIETMLGIQSNTEVSRESAILGVLGLALEEELRGRVRNRLRGLVADLLDGSSPAPQADALPTPSHDGQGQPISGRDELKSVVREAMREEYAGPEFEAAVRRVLVSGLPREDSNIESGNARPMERAQGPASTGRPPRE